MFGMKTRGQKKAEGKLGYLSDGGKPESYEQSQITPVIGSGGSSNVQTCRSKLLKKYNDYYDDIAYDHLMDWKDGAQRDPPASIYDRKPFIRLNLAKLLSSRISAKLFGGDVWPELNIDGDPESEFYFKLIIKESMVQSACLSGGKRLPCNGSTFIRFYVIGNKFMTEAFNSNYCYPEFDEVGELGQVEIRYIYVDDADLDDKGLPKKKWYRAILTKEFDVLFDNPEYKQDREPIFEVVDEIPHMMGFVQGEWFKTSHVANYIDGPSLMGDVVPFLDSMNYSISLSQESSDYNTAPQLGIANLDEDEMEKLIRSNTKAWNLGREGKAAFIESDMGGVEMSMGMRDKNRTFIQDLTRVTMLDPEKLVGSAQSGKAMEILHGPLVELIGELRPQAEKHLRNLILKMAAANLISIAKFGIGPVTVPRGWVPKTSEFQLNWPPVFPLTIQDKQQFVSLVVSAVSGNVISRRTGVKNLAPYFGIEDVEAELNEIVNQPVIATPFGAF